MVAFIPINIAVDWCGKDIDKESKAIVLKCHNMQEAITTLSQSGFTDDAIRLFSSLIDSKTCIYWAWCCIKHYLEKKLTDDSRLALISVEKWLAEPTQEGLVAAWNAAESEEELSPAGCLCRAVYWTGDNVVPPDIEVAEKVPPAPQLPAKISAVALITLGLTLSPENPDTIYQQCLDLGLSICEQNKE